MKQTASILCAITFCIFTSEASAKVDPNSRLELAPDRLSVQPDNASAVWLGATTTSAPTSANIAEYIPSLLESRGALSATQAARTRYQQRASTLDPDGRKHVRLDQHHQGVRVFGRQVIAHYSPANEFLGINGIVQTLEELNVTPSLSPQTAIDRARIESFGSGVTAESSQAPELVIWALNESPRLGWLVTVTQPNTLQGFTCIIDAHNSELIYSESLVHSTVAIGTGVSTLGQARNHIDVDFNDEYYLVDNTRRSTSDPHGHAGQMLSGASIITHIAENNSLPGPVGLDVDNLWLSTNQRSAIDGHVYTALIYDWMLDQLGRNSFDDLGSTMRLTTVYPGPNGPNNAFYIGGASPQVVFGTWFGGWRALTCAPDVVAHEWGHGITDKTSDLIRQKESGTLNESFSDMLGAAFEWAHDTMDTPDWYFAENGVPLSNGTRAYDDPTIFNHPDSYGTDNPLWFDHTHCTPTPANQECGIYTNAGVTNKWFYLLSDGGTHRGVTVHGVSPANAIKVAYRANAFYWTPSEDIHSASYGTVQAGMDLDPTSEWAVSAADAWEAVDVKTYNPALAISADTIIGQPGLQVNFTGESIRTVNSWTWSFGDGDSAFGQTPSHIYTAPGLYPVGLAIDAVEEQRETLYDQMIAIHADTLEPITVMGDPGQEISIEIYARNFVPLTSLVIPFSWSADLDMTLSHVELSGLRTTGMSVTQLSIDPFNRKAAYRLTITNSDTLMPGAGAVLRVVFDIPAEPSGDSSVVSIEPVGLHSPLFKSMYGDYSPEPLSGVVSVLCCTVPGDADNSSAVNIGDVTFLISRIFNNGPAPDCQDEADANGSNSINIADATYLIARIFSGGPAPICGTSGS